MSLLGLLAALLLPPPLCLIARASKEMATNARSTKNWLQILIRSFNNKQPEVKNQKARKETHTERKRETETVKRAFLVGVATEQIELYSTEAEASGTGAEAKMIRQSNQSVNQLMATGKARTV